MKVLQRIERTSFERDSIKPSSEKLTACLPLTIMWSATLMSFKKQLKIIFLVKSRSSLLGMHLLFGWLWVIIILSLLFARARSVMSLMLTLTVEPVPIAKSLAQMTLFAGLRQIAKNCSMFDSV